MEINQRVSLFVGQQVAIKDGSYMVAVEDGKVVYKTKRIPYIGLNKDTWTILGLEGKYPTDNNNRHHQTDCRIQNNDNGEIWFCVANVSLKVIITQKPQKDETLKLELLINTIKAEIAFLEKMALETTIGGWPTQHVNHQVGRANELKALLYDIENK